MALSKKGIDKLEKAMLADCSRYVQRTFGEIDSQCGTVMCAAGFCRMLRIGRRAFDKEVKKAFMHLTYDAFSDRCVRDGCKLLGIKRKYKTLLPAVFDFPYKWPFDMQRAFATARSKKAKVKVYIKILRTRTTASGDILEKVKGTK